MVGAGTPHAFIGFGPYVNRDFVHNLHDSATSNEIGSTPLEGQSSNPGTSFGLSLTLGGWL